MPPTYNSIKKLRSLGYTKVGAAKELGISIEQYDYILRQEQRRKNSIKKEKEEVLKYKQYLAHVKKESSMPIEAKQYSVACDMPGCDKQAVGHLRQLSTAGWHSKTMVNGSPRLDSISSYQGYPIVCPSCSVTGAWKRNA